MKPEERAELERARYSIEDTLLRIDWSVFKTRGTIQKSLELQSLLVNAKRKALVMLLEDYNAIQESTATDKAEEE